MAAYTIEDIELIRRKSGISYQEAVALLDYHNGNVARALVDLERNGRIAPDGKPAAKAQSDSRKGQTATASATFEKSDTKGAFMSLVQKLYRARIKIRKDDTPILNVSLLFGILSLFIGSFLVIVGVIVCLVLGYRFSFTSHDPAFDGDNLERMVRNAADNVKSSVTDFTRGFQDGAAPKEEKDEQPAKADRSYYAAKPAAATANYHQPSAPTLNVPVQVESQDGTVSMEADSEGYTSATIE